MLDNEEIDTLVQRRLVELAEHRKARAEISAETHRQFSALSPVLRELVAPLNAKLTGAANLVITDQGEDLLVTFFSARYQGGHYIKGVFEVRLTFDSKIEILMRIHGETVPDEILTFDQATAERLGRRLNLFVADCLRTPSHPQ